MKVRKLVMAPPATSSSHASSGSSNRCPARITVEMMKAALCISWCPTESVTKEPGAGVSASIRRTVSWIFSAKS